MSDLLVQEISNQRAMCAQVHCLDTYWDPRHAIPCSLTTFLNRPFLYHVVDRLVGQGVRTIEFACHRFQADMERCLGDGSRWGATFRFLSADQRSQLSASSMSVASHALPYASPSDPIRRSLRIDTPREYLKAQSAALAGDAESFLTVETEIAPSLWVGRNVKIHPSATLHGPLLIGENTRVGSGVCLGPSTVVGPNCVIGRNTVISNSTVMPNLFVGEGLTVAQSILFSDRIFNVRLETTVEVTDRLLVSHIR